MPHTKEHKEEMKENGKSKFKINKKTLVLAGYALAIAIILIIGFNMAYKSGLSSDNEQTDNTPVETSSSCGVKAGATCANLNQEKCMNNPDACSPDYSSASGAYVSCKIKSAGACMKLTSEQCAKNPDVCLLA